MHSQKFRWILTTIYYAKVFKLFINSIGSTCHHIEIYQKGKLGGQWVGKELKEIEIDMADNDRNFYCNLEASPRSQVIKIFGSSFHSLSQRSMISGGKLFI